MNLICRIKEIYKALYLFEREFAEEHNMTINEAMLLCCMKDEHPHSANEIAEFIGLSNPRVSKIITSTEERGWIVRKMGTEDKRKMIFTLSAQGKEAMKTITEQHIHLNDTLLKLIGDKPEQL